MAKEPKETSILDLTLIILKNVKPLVFVPVGVFVLFVILMVLSKFLPSDSPLSLFPDEYTPKARIVLKIPGEAGGISGLLGGSSFSLGALAGVLGGRGDLTSELGNFIFVTLSSNSLQDKIIKEFDFYTKYEKVDYPIEDIRNIFSKKIYFEMDETFTCAELGYTDTDPQWATDVVTRIAEEVEGRIKTVYSQQTRQTRVFLEERLDAQTRSLKEAQDKLITYQKENEIVDVTLQSKATVSYISELQAQIYKKEFELKSLKENYSFNKIDIESKQYELKQLKELLTEMKTGFQQYSNEFIPQEKIPELAVEYVHLTQEVELQASIMKLLRQQYETIKIEEADTTRVINFLDRPQVPEKKSGPPRTLLVILITMASFFLTFFAIMFKETVLNLSRDPEEAEKVEAIKAAHAALFHRKKS